MSSRHIFLCVLIYPTSLFRPIIGDFACLSQYRLFLYSLFLIVHLLSLFLLSSSLLLLQSTRPFAPRTPFPPHVTILLISCGVTLGGETRGSNKVLPRNAKKQTRPKIPRNAVEPKNEMPKIPQIKQEMQKIYSIFLNN